LFVVNQAWWLKPKKMNCMSRSKARHSTAAKIGCKGVSKRKCEETQAVDDSICYICMNDEPDKTKMT